MRREPDSNLNGTNRIFTAELLRILDRKGVLWEQILKTRLVMIYIP